MLPFFSRFVDGELNICYNAVDRHVENGRGNQIAIMYDSPVTNIKEAITFKEVLEQVQLMLESDYLKEIRNVALHGIW